MRAVHLLWLVLGACAPDEKAGGEEEESTEDPVEEEECDDVWYADDDGDGFGDPGDSQTACEVPDGHVADATDCDDSDGTVHPGATELCDDDDNDCNGEVDDNATDQSTWYADLDGDTFGDAESTLESCDGGYGWVANDEDCDDTNAYAAPTAPEFCDGVDNDCDGEVDEDDDAVDPHDWYPDSDGDGYGADDEPGTMSCAEISGYVTNARDCDDADSGSYPDADEYCDDIDNDCDGYTDEDAVDALAWYDDEDGDGYGETDTESIECEAPSEISVNEPDDCDDSRSQDYPEAPELCDSRDNDCDGDVDEEEDVEDPYVWYADDDGDGYGDPDDTIEDCDQPSGYVSSAGDCDDADPEMGPSAEETWYDGVDDDCDGESDYDADADGYDSSDWGGTDCDDTTDMVYPGADEYCDGLDNDCDGSSDPDDSLDTLTWYADSDNDGYGDPLTTTEACNEPSGYVLGDEDTIDCDDTDPSVGLCSCELTAVSSPTSLVSSGSTYGAWMGDPEETLGSGLIWEMEGYNSSTLVEYASEADMISRSSGSTTTLPYAFDGTGGVVYDGYLYYNQSGTNTLVQYDISSGSTVDTLTLTGAGYRNTYHYGWGGYSDIDFAVDEQGLWVLYSTSSNGGKMVISKLETSPFAIEDSWNTNSINKTSIGNAFMICGVMYTTASYSSYTTTVNYAYDTEDSSDWLPALTFYNGYGYNSSISYNPADGVLYSWDSGNRVTYETTVE